MVLSNQGFIILFLLELSFCTNFNFSLGGNGEGERGRGRGKGGGGKVEEGRWRRGLYPCQNSFTPSF